MCNFMLLFQGYHIDLLTPLEAVMVLYRTEKCLGHPIPEEYLKNGWLDKWLISADFEALPVSSHQS